MTLTLGKVEHCLGNAIIRGNSHYHASGDDMLLSYTWYNCSTFIALVGEV